MITHSEESPNTTQVVVYSLYKAHTNKLCLSHCFVLSFPLVVQRCPVCSPNTSTSVSSSPNIPPFSANTATTPLHLLLPTTPTPPHPPPQNQTSPPSSLRSASSSPPRAPPTPSSSPPTRAPSSSPPVAVSESPSTPSTPTSIFSAQCKK